MAYSMIDHDPLVIQRCEEAGLHVSQERLKLKVLVCWPVSEISKPRHWLTVAVALDRTTRPWISPLSLQAVWLKVMEDGLNNVHLDRLWRAEGRIK